MAPKPPTTAMRKTAPTSDPMAKVNRSMAPLTMANHSSQRGAAPLFTMRMPVGKIPRPSRVRASSKQVQIKGTVPVIDVDSEADLVTIVRTSA